MSMADRDGWIWYDGKMVPWRDATTHVLTHTLHYGMGVFEGVRCYKTQSGPRSSACAITPSGCSALRASSA
jgi:branched-chain amino acid aminotransferase